MKLLYPEFLWALTALSIPIIIHLFNFRKFTKVYFSNIELLKEVKLETKSKSRLKHSSYTSYSLTTCYLPRICFRTTLYSCRKRKTTWR